MESALRFNPNEQIRDFMFRSGVYHFLYRASEYLGGETWGDNLSAHRKVIEQIPEANRLGGDFKILLLGSATPTSIEQSLSAIKEWENGGLIKNGGLTVVDLESGSYDRLKPELRDQVNFVRMDVRNPGFKSGSFDFITSDYLLNFIPLSDLPDTVANLGTLLKKGGVFDATVDTKKASIISKASGNFFVRNGLKKEQLDTSVGRSNEYQLLAPQRAHSKGLAKMSEVGSNRIVWSFQRN